MFNKYGKDSREFQKAYENFTFKKKEYKELDKKQKQLKFIARSR